MTDPVDRLARYAPTAAVLDTEWSQRASQAVLNDIIGSDPTAGDTTGNAADDAPPRGDTIPLHFVPARRARVPRRAAISLAASVAAIAVGGGALVTLLPGGDSPKIETGGGAPTPSASASSSFTPPAGLSDQALPEGQYAVVTTRVLQVGDAARPVQRSYVDATGREALLTEGTDCLNRGETPARATFDQPDEQFLGELPTDPDELAAYVRARVHGSSSRDEAVFVWVGDTLRFADDLASPRLRAAMLAVLSRTPGVTLHYDVRDDEGRAAIRADFVNSATRGSHVQVLYFDPTLFHLLEDAEADSDAQAPHAESSPAYTAPAPRGGADPDVLSDVSFRATYTDRGRVAHLPALPTCDNGDDPTGGHGG